jgi:hypothetical protein
MTRTSERGNTETMRATRCDGRCGNGGGGNSVLTTVVDYIKWVAVAPSLWALSWALWGVRAVLRCALHVVTLAHLRPYVPARWVAGLEVVEESYAIEGALPFTPADVWAAFADYEWLQTHVHEGGIRSRIHGARRNGPGALFRTLHGGVYLDETLLVKNDATRTWTIGVAENEAFHHYVVSIAIADADRIFSPGSIVSVTGAIAVKWPFTLTMLMPLFRANLARLEKVVGDHQRLCDDHKKKA